MSFPAYPAYKDSGVEWLGEVPAHWAVDRLLGIASYNDEVLADGTPAGIEIDYVEISGVSAGSGNLVSTVVAFGDAPSRARRLVRDGDILISTVRTYLRAIAMVRDAPSNLVASTGFAVVRPRSVHAGFLGFAVQAEAFIAEIISKSVGVSYPAINASDLVRIRIPVPPTAEQAAIAAFLDRETGKIDALVEEQRRLIALLKEKRQAVISHAVTKGLNPNAPLKPSGVDWLGDVPAHWEVAPFGMITLAIQTGPFGSQLHAEDYIEDGVPVINPSNIRDGMIVPNSSNTVEEHLAFALSHHRLSAGEIVLARRGEMGRCAVVHDDQTGWLCGTGCLRIALGHAAVPEFVATYLGTPFVVEALRLFSVGATMDNLNASIVSKIRAPLPPVDEQRETMAGLSQVLLGLDRLGGETERAITLLQERRAALISAAVTGKIDVRGLVSTAETRQAA